MRSIAGALTVFSARLEPILAWLEAGLVIVYALIRVASTQAALHAPRQLADTAIYLRISTQPILGPNFLHVNRPFVFPFLLQILHQNLETAAIAQLMITICAWAALGFAVSAALRPAWISQLAFITILALSLVRYLAGWDFVMLTESLSLSMFALLIASGIWLAQGWSTARAVFVCAVALLFAFTRDTNAYLLLMSAGLLTIAAIARWAPARVLTLCAALIGIFLLSNLNADVSERWIFPLVNVIGKRMLPYSASTRALTDCGMPASPELLSLADTFANGQDRAFFNDPALESFRDWIARDGKTCYMRWLISNPTRSAAQAYSEFGELIYFSNVNGYFSRRYQDLLPSRVEHLLYPVYFVSWIWAGLTIAALYAVIKKLWRDNPLWMVLILLCLTIFPHLFITWHGDAMAPNRHAVSVGMQLAVTLWLFIFLALERAHSHFTQPIAS